jgi:hypothetical protein
MSSQGYVGVTQNLRQRMKVHKCKLSAAKDFGWENLTHSVVGEFDNKALADLYEHELRPSPFIGWNNAPGGGCNKGHKHTDESRAKNSAAQIGSKGNNYKGPMIGKNIETGEILHRFEGSAAAEAAGFNKGSISQVINGKRKTHKKLTWTREAIK